MNTTAARTSALYRQSRNGEPPVRYHEIVSRGSKLKIAKWGGTLLTVFALLGDGNVDALGDFGRSATQSELKAEAAEVAKPFIEDLANRPATERFRFAFLGTQMSGEVDLNRDENGLLGIAAHVMENRNEFILSGETCLQDTAYDIDASSIYGRSYGNISAVAAIRYSAADTNSIEVLPFGNNDTMLTLASSSDGTLMPATPTDERILDAYGCDVGSINFDLP